MVLRDLSFSLSQLQFLKTLYNIKDYYTSLIQQLLTHDFCQFVINLRFLQRATTFLRVTTNVRLLELYSPLEFFNN